MVKIGNNQKKYEVLTVFDTCVDLIVDLGETIPEFDQKEKLVKDFGLYMGGSACIFAAQCAKLGLSATGVGILGQDAFGALVKETLASSGVDVSHVKEDPLVKTGLGISLNRGADRSILTYDQSIRAVKASMVTDGLLAQARHLHLASYYLLEGVAREAVSLLRRAKALGLTVSLDTNWDPSEQWEIPPELWKLVDVFLPNENEICLLSGRNAPEEALEYFRRIVPLVVMKRGEKGAVAASERELAALPTVPTKVADTVGAGDSFDGGFLYGFLRGWPLEKALRLGILCGSHNVSCFGGYAGQLTQEEAQNLLKEK